MFVPPRETANAVRFLRNNVPCAIVGHSNGICSYEIPNTRYTYGCSSTSSYTLTIPAENMTEYEQGSMWMCQYSFDLGVRFRSLVVTLHIAGTYHLSGLFIASLFSSFTNYVRTKTLFFTLALNWYFVCEFNLVKCRSLQFCRFLVVTFIERSNAMIEICRRHILFDMRVYHDWAVF